MPEEESRRSDDPHCGSGRSTTTATVWRIPAVETVEDSTAVFGVAVQLIQSSGVSALRGTPERGAFR
jgi:hypothetical protein